MPPRPAPSSWTGSASPDPSSGIGSAYAEPVAGDLPAGAVTLPAVTTARRPAWRAAVAVVALLAVGLGVALGVGSALGISAEPVAGMDAVPAVVGTVAAAVPPPTIEVVDAPRTERTTVALAALGCRRIRLEPTRQRHPDPAPRRRRPRRRHLPPRRGRLGDGGHVGERERRRSSGLRPRGIRAQRPPVTERLGQEVRSRLPFRMVDLGAVGVTPDPAQWASGTDYSHALEGVRRRHPADRAVRRPGRARRRPTPTSTPSCGTASPTATPPSAFPGFHRVRHPAERPRRAGLPGRRRARRPGAGDAQGLQPRSGTAPRSSA